eukprot:15459578-Alexandrium_andersonii.AAC.1
MRWHKAPSAEVWRCSVPGRALRASLWPRRAAARERLPGPPRRGRRRMPANALRPAIWPGGARRPRP